MLHIDAALARDALIQTQRHIGIDVLGVAGHAQEVDGRLGAFALGDHLGGELFVAVVVGSVGVGRERTAQHP